MTPTEPYQGMDEREAMEEDDSVVEEEVKSEGATYDSQWRKQPPPTIKKSKRRKWLWKRPRPHKIRLQK